MVDTARRLAFSASVLSLASAAHGEEPAAVIVVTGERQPRPLDETPSSVTVITPEESAAAAAGEHRIEDWLAAIPNVRLGSGSEGPTIRGQDGNGPLRDLPGFLGGVRPRVTLQIDGRAVSYNELAYGVTNLWDVERIEVYRSPQTTTQGRNAIAGAIFAYTRAPTFEWEGRSRVLAGDARTRQLSAVVSGPLIADVLAFRVSGDIRRSRPSTRISGIATAIDYNRDRYAVARLKLLAEPGALPGLRLTASASHNRSSAPQVEGAREPFKLRRDGEATYGFFDVRVDAASLAAEWAFAPGWDFKATMTAGDAAIRRNAPPGFGVTRIGARDSSAEGVLRWRAGDDLSLLAGLHYSRARLDQRIDLEAAQIGVGEFQDFQQSIGLFGQADWQPTARLSLAAGARFQQDDQDRTGILGVGRTDPLGVDFDQRFKRLLPKFTATWQVSEGLHAGVLVQRAYNPGGVSIDARRRVVQTFAAETLWVYEVFVRAGSAGSPLHAAINAFYYDQSNLQRTLQRQIPSPIGPVTIAEIGNALAGRNYGAELEADWRPSPRWRISGGVGFLRTRLTWTALPSDPLLGKEFQLSPHFTASASAEWTPLDALRLSLRARHHSGYFSDDANDPTRRVAGASVIDAGASWSHGGLSLSAYLRNALDAFYLTYKYSAAQRLATPGDPREFGIAAEWRF